MRRLLVICVLAALPVPAANAHTLTYRDARKAAQLEADAFAKASTSLRSLLRVTRHRYTAGAEWAYVDPTGCKACVYDESTGTFRDGPETVQCSVTVVVRYRSHRSRRPVAFVDGHACF